MPDDDASTGDGISRTAAYLRARPPLTPRQPGSWTPCKICGYPAEPFCMLDFNTACNDPGIFEPAGLAVSYVRCTKCECLFTRLCDDWTSQDYADLIYNSEYILVDGEYDGTRAARDAVHMAALLHGAEDFRLLDYGSGLGHFARVMQERGFRDIGCYDPFSHPVRPEGRFDIITSFETIEHSADPVGTIRDMLALMADDGCLLIGQTLQPTDIEEQGGGWWYLGPRNGHISTFSHETIRAFADAEGLLFNSFGGLFALSRPGRRPFVTDLIVPRTVPSRRAMLFAPAAADRIQGWHGFEASGADEFRWTGAGEVPLGEIALDAEVDLIVPYVLEIAPGMAAGAHLRVGDTVLPLRQRRRELVASFAPAQPGRFAISLVTPEPVRPSAGEAGGDDRPLGLAIRCARTTTLNPIRAAAYPQD